MYEIRAGVQTFENVLIMAACLLIRTDRWRMIMSKSLELQIVSECAPTLAGIKTANLFNYKYSDKEAFILELDSANEELNKKGLYIKALRSSDTSALIYVYRRNLLFKDLNKDEVWNILTEYGYTIRNVDESIKRLEQRLGESVCFPHEIGLFLGYPAEDVKEFIANKGQNCKCCGVWKVYSNEQESVRTFERFKKCSMVYQKVFTVGRTLNQLTVNA